MPQKNKILVIASSFPKFKDDINGNFVYELSSRLSSSFEIHVLAPAYKGSKSKETINNITVHRHKQFLWHIELAYGIGIYENLKRKKWKIIALPFYFLFLIVAIRKIVLKEKITLCHAHWLIPNALMAVVCKKLFGLKYKTLATIHGSDFWGFDNTLGNALKKHTFNKIDALTVVSHVIKEKVLEMGYKKEVFVYPMGIDTQVFNPDKKDSSLKEKYGITGNFLLFVGIVVEQKGIRHLIEAMPLILEKHPNTKLLVVGEGNLKNEMIDLSKKLKVSDSVVFTGAIPHNDLPPYFATADLLVLPSFSEGFGLVIIEALSCKTIAVTSDLPSIHDIINEGHTGFFFKKINTFEISKRINYIISNYNTFNHVKDNGRNYVVLNFNWNIVVNNYKSLYNNLLNI